MIAFPVIPDALTTGNWIPLAIPLIGLPFVISCFFWMSAPTIEGRGVLDRIAGFKQYLSITERERLDRMHRPRTRPSFSNAICPTRSLSASRTAGRTAYAACRGRSCSPGRQGFAWYSGSAIPGTIPAASSIIVGSSLASTISSASTAPGSSSGSGGGGFSGGGGGGGGGGGW